METARGLAANGATFHTDRVLSHSPERVFEAFARAEVFARWWGPSGFTNTFETFEFRPGGRWKYVMHGPNGANHPNESVFEVLEPARLVIRHVSKPHYVLTITLEPGDPGSRITWAQEFETRELAARLEHVVVPANEQNLDRLEAALAGS